MKQLADALEDLGTPLPFRFVSDVQVYPGHFVILLAGSGVGKSFFALNWATDVVNAGLPCLYHTPDTSYRDQAKRLVALMRNTLVDEVDLRRDRKWLRENVMPLRWSQANVKAEQFTELMDAECEYLGEPPALVIVDLFKYLIKGEDSPERYQEAFRILKQTARKYKTAILAVHEVNRSSVGGNKKRPPELADGRYGGEFDAELVLALGQPNPRTLEVAIRKNRNGVDGFSRLLDFAPERGRVG